MVRDHATLVVAADLDPEARAVAERVAAERHARLVEPATPWPGCGCARRAASSARNFALACAAAEAFLGPRARPGAVARAAAETRDARAGSTWWPSSRSPSTTAPTTPPAREALAAALPEVLGERRAASCSWPACSRTRTRRRCSAALLPGVRPRRVHALREPARAVAGHARSAGATRLGGPPARDRRRTRGARSSARASWPGPDGAVVATGSIYLIADLVREPGAGARLDASDDGRIIGPSWTAVTDPASAR